MASLTILFRYLTLYYASSEGLRVLIPRKHHRAVLRDTATDTVVSLSEAFVSLQVDRKPVPTAATRVYPDGLLVAMEDVLHRTETIKPHSGLLNPHVDPLLNALFTLSDGSLTAYSGEAFPELPTGNIGGTEMRVTDTTLYEWSLPAGSSAHYELVVRSKRGTVRIDVTHGARFEVRNEDEKFGKAPSHQDYAREEFETLLGLLDLGDKRFNLLCDYFQCLCSYCGKYETDANGNAIVIQRNSIHRS
jgi:hypothetical protein